METQLNAYDVCRHILSDWDSCPVELRNRISGYIRSRDFERLSTLVTEVDLTLYDQHTFSALRQVQALFNKNAAFVDNVRCTNAAIDSFKSAEDQCKATNELYDDLLKDPKLLGSEFLGQVHLVRRFISAVLGPSKESCEEFLKELPATIRITGGATATTSRANSHPYQKIAREICATEGAVKYLEYVRNHGGYVAPRFTVSNWNRIEFVSKNYKTHRTIACEPTGNVPLQLAFDSYAKKRLRRYGVDLSSQFLNQELARVGSIDGSYATLDMKAASDTVAFNVVQHFFPKYWRSFLCDIRTPFYKHSELGTERYQKFSSMGNGATFAIESLLFSAACFAVSASDNCHRLRAEGWSVYGDDIVIKTEHAEALVLLLSRMGFSLNAEKSFFSGPFRESCGCDWWKGVNITPFYIRSLDDMKTTLSHNINGLAGLGWEDSALWIYLRSVVRKNRLIQAPWNENTRTGILIPVSSAYAKKLIKKPTNRTHGRGKRPLVVNYEPTFDGYRLVVKKKTHPSDSVALFLWFQKNCSRRVVFTPLGVGDSDPLDLTFELATSALTAKQHLKYKVASLRFWPTTAGTPVHLYSWAEWLDRTV